MSHAGSKPLGVSDDNVTGTLALSGANASSFTLSGRDLNTATQINGTVNVTITANP
jgi:hypothetical protein